MADRSKVVLQCQYIKPDGVRCGSPAVKGKRHCYFHGRALPRIRRRTRDGRLLPVFEGDDPVEVIFVQTADAILNRHIGPQQAKIMLCVLQIASATSKRRRAERQQQEVYQD